jgi:hypothetical protein
MAIPKWIVGSGLTSLILTNPSFTSPFTPHEPPMRSFGFLPEVFLGCLHFLGLGGIDLGNQILIFPAAEIILQG